MMRIIAALSENDFNVPKTSLDNAATQNIFQIVFAFIGVIALVVLLLASLKYITSRGDPQAVAKAKNTIVYAAIGLVVSASAFTIVGFVVGRV